MSNSELDKLSSPAPLASLVDVQAGSVVSKALLQKPEGTFTIFAFDTNQGLSPHTAPFDAVVTALEGRAEIGVLQKTYKVSAGQSLWFPKGALHSVKALTPFKMSLVMIKA